MLRSLPSAASICAGLIGNTEVDLGGLPGPLSLVCKPEYDQRPSIKRLSFYIDVDRASVRWILPWAIHYPARAAKKFHDELRTDKF